MSGLLGGFASEYVAFLLRWLHVVAAIAWIGESFYFVALDRGLKPPRLPAPGLYGESWSVHGGGFYLKQKFLPAPAELPAELHWSKWKAYTTWLSGFALFTLVYLAAPSVWLVDPAVAPLGESQAVWLALAFPLLGWFGYDGLCRLAGSRERVLGALVAGLVLLLCYAATQLFSGRAAFLLVGATLGTVMSANVFFVIIPGQKRMVAALAQGGTADPRDGQRGKQRSVHNTYFTLPVVFAMVAIHFAAAWSHPLNWLVLAVFMAIGALLRQFFVLWHDGARAWGLLAASAVLLLALGAWLSPRPQPVPSAITGAGEAPASTTDAFAAAPGPRSSDDSAAAPESPVVAPASGAGASVPGSGAETPVGAPGAVREASGVSAADATGTLAIQPVLARHCVSCHSARPTLMPAPPLGVAYDTPEQIELHAARIHRQAVELKTMPPGNLSGMTAAERDALDRWFRALGARH